MRLDVRWPIGGMFTIVGAILAVYGVVSDRAIYERSLGINVNLWWGLVLLVFGLVMLAFARRAMTPKPPEPGQRPPAAS
ncbi:MAG TPA: hypothetical protein VGQ29_00785 [Gemmatimonadales bacterium]|jgi:protein-S-isoprenylcysteine O-methyltransferase Ste14|nr:hypothetical protein [Gemmatimonadales bacterium]